MDALLQALDGRPRRIPDIGRALAWHGLIAALTRHRRLRSKCMVRTYAAECATTQRACQSVRTRADPHAHVCRRLSRHRSPDAPDAGRRRKRIVPLCLPACAETGKLYDFRERKFMDFQSPA